MGRLADALKLQDEIVGMNRGSVQEKHQSVCVCVSVSVCVCLLLLERSPVHCMHVTHYGQLMQSAIVASR